MGTKQYYPNRIRWKIDSNRRAEIVWITDKIIALRGLDNGEQLSTFLANQDLQHVIHLPLSESPLKIALELLKKMMGSNFIPCVFTLASVPLNCHFEYLQTKLGICPVVVLVGHPRSGKTTSLERLLLDWKPIK